MAQRPTVVKKTTTNVAPHRKYVEPEPEEDYEDDDGAEVDEVDETDDDEYDEDADASGYDEEEVQPKKKVVAPPPAAKTVKKVVPPPPMKTPPAKPQAKPVAAKPVAAKPVAPVRAPKVMANVEADIEEDAEEPVEAVKTGSASIRVKKVDGTVVEILLPAIMQALSKDTAITITKLEDNKWQIATGVATKPKLSGKAFLEEVCTPEYLEWEREWQSKTYNEKVDWAAKLKARWTESDPPDQRVNIIRMSQAVKDKLGIVKYKPEYASTSSRAQLTR